METSVAQSHPIACIACGGAHFALTCNAASDTSIDVAISIDNARTARIDGFGCHFAILQGLR